MRLVNPFFLMLFIFMHVADVAAKNELKPETPPDQVIPVNENDVKIILRASVILSDESKWDRKEVRVCLAGATEIGLYCALYKAGLDQR